MKLRQRRRHLLLPVRGPLLAVLYLLIAVLLAACSSTGNVPSEQAREPLQEDHHPYLLTIDLQAGDDPDLVADLFGGEVIVWAEEDFAVLGFDSDPQADAGFSPLGAGRNAVSERNGEVSISPDGLRMQGTSGLWAGGTSDLWAGGTSDLWAGGTSWLWAGGTSDLWAGGTSWLWGGGHFEWMPGNSDTLKRIGLDEAQALFDERDDVSNEVRVAVIDTGLDMDHPAFSSPGIVSPGPDYVSSWRDRDGPRESGNYDDAGYGHGTSVAGIVRQVAPLATIVPIRILDPEGKGEAADLAKAIVWAVAVGNVDVINASLGGERNSRAVDAAIRYAGRKGVFVVASTGDSGTTEVTFPAATAHRRSNLLSVASVGPDDTKSDFSPFHPVRVLVSAPGEEILGPAPDGRLAAWSGTSMAAPMVSGALALALAAEKAGWELQVPRARLAEVLLETTDDVDAVNPRYRGKLGAGRLDVAAFLHAALHVQGDGEGDGEDDGELDEDDRRWEDDRPGRGRGRGRDYDPPGRFDRRSPSYDWIFDRWREGRWGSSDSPGRWGRGR